MTVCWSHTATAMDKLNVSIVSVDVGLISDFQQPESKYSIFPELQIGGLFFTSYLTWGLSWGYWDDGVDKPFPIRDAFTYTYSSHVVGAHVTFFPKKVLIGWIFPIDVNIGVSQHYIDAEYVGGTNLSGLPGKDFTEGSTMVEFGTGTGISVTKSMRLRLGVTSYVPTDEILTTDFDDDRTAFKFGFEYSFR